MTLELNDAARAALIELLTETIERDRFPRLPRVRVLRGILGKRAPQPPAPEPIPAPKQSTRPSAALTKKRRKLDRIGILLNL